MNDGWLIPNGQATYILRYFLPRPPYVNALATQMRFNELMAFCLRAKVDTLQLYVSFRPDWYYLPDTIEHARVWADEMKGYISAIRQAGISYQLNFVIILGANVGGIGEAVDHDYPYEHLVNQHGMTAHGCGCPIGKRFREIMGEQLQVWAETQPDIIWIDDDFRLHNHGLTKESLDWYCFCTDHLQLFTKRYGHQLSRHQVIEKVLQPGSPSQARSIWLDLMNDTMVDTADWISQTIHQISPETRIALMTSTPLVHSCEGRHWGQLLESLTGPDMIPLIRPHFGPYSEQSPMEFVNCYRLADQTMTHIRMQYCKPVDYCPEIENTRFTTWSKSVSATTFQLYLGQLMGCRGITLSLFDLEGTALDEEPAYEEMLIQCKPALDALAAMELATWKRDGLSILTDARLAYKVQLTENAGPDLPNLSDTWPAPLLVMGIPIVFRSTTEIGQQDIAVLDGLNAWSPEPNEMLRLLSGSVLMDGQAAEVLVQRGFGHLIGVESTGLLTVNTSAELFFGNILPELTDKRMPLRLKPGQCVVSKPLPGVHILSQIIAADGARYPASSIVENSLGGRIAVYAGCHDLIGAGFLNHQRMRWIHAVINWLGYGSWQTEIHTRQKIITIRQDRDGQILLAIANLSVDLLTVIHGKIICKGTITNCRHLSVSGEWLELPRTVCNHLEGQQYELVIPTKVSVYTWFILLIDYVIE